MSHSGAAAAGNGPNSAPRFADWTRNLRFDLVAGFLVFLIALPLCIGISKASGYPAFAGVMTAIVGGIVAACISNSELTIKGPAAGLIPIALGCMTQFSETGVDPIAAYRMALAVGAAAAVLQILFAVFRSGVLGEFFPTSTVHGMLAAIGIIIMAKQLPVMLGVELTGEPLRLIARIPEMIENMNPAVALVGLVSLLILFGLPLIKNKYVRRIPGPMVVLLVSIPLGILLDLTQEHTYSLFGHNYKLGETYLVKVPDSLWSAVTTPDLSALRMPVAWKWVVMLALIGSLESLLSAKAIDLLDPWKRKSNLNRDLLSVGIGNLVCASIGGLPMISEIVRSRANIDNGARTRLSNLFHGLFLLICVVSIPGLIHRIPNAALAAMLVYTGFRLAHPREFVHVFRIGPEQLVIYVTTIVVTLATDLLVGVGTGIGVKFAIHLINGVPLRSLFKPYLDIERRDDDTYLATAHQAAVFSNWIPFKRQIEDVGLVGRKNVIVDLSEVKLVDHSVMEKLHELQREFRLEGLSLEIIGLDLHRGLSRHPEAARKRGLATIRRVTVVCEPDVRDVIVEQLAAIGVSGYTVIDCTGAGRTGLATDPLTPHPMVRIEVMAVREVAERLLAYLNREIKPSRPLTASIEIVHVVRQEEFEVGAPSSVSGNGDGTASALARSMGH